MTAFEVFEHLPEPRPEIDSMRALSANIVFSTLLSPSLLLTPTSDLHMFLDPQAIPRHVVAEWFRQWTRSQPLHVRKLAGEAYEFEPRGYPKGGVRQQIRNLYDRRRKGGIFSLHAGFSPDSVGVLANAGFGHAYISHLLQKGADYWEQICTHLQARTMDDMLLLRTRILPAEGL